MKLKYKLLHNPRCRKSRESLLFLKSNKIDFEIILYLINKLDRNELKKIIENSGLNITDFIRTQEKLWKSSFKTKKLSENEILQIFELNPTLIQRPIFFSSKKSVIANPPEKVLEVIN